MLGFRYQNFCIESFALNLPQTQVSSAELEDRVGELYQKFNIPFGTLEKLSGVKSRYLWDPMTGPSVKAAEAGKEALDQIGFAREQVNVIINCSVTRDYFEPATSVLAHRILELPEQSMAFDISNACIGFSNGIAMLANMIESGVTKAGIIVSAENIARIIESSVDLMKKRADTLTRDEFVKLLPTFTLGCGAVAMVLCHSSIATKSHRVLGTVSRTASQHADLCVGNGDFCVFQKSDLEPIMNTESQLLISSAAKLGSRNWADSSEWFGWSREDVDHVFCHQVGKQVNNSFYQTLGLDISKEFTVYQRYGNLVSAALPSALITGAKEKGMKTGDKVVCLGFGSGLNSINTAIRW